MRRRDCPTPTRSRAFDRPFQIHAHFQRGGDDFSRVVRVFQQLDQALRLLFFPRFRADRVLRLVHGDFSLLACQNLWYTTQKNDFGGGIIMFEVRPRMPSFDEFAPGAPRRDLEIADLLFGLIGWLIRLALQPLFLLIWKIKNR